MSNDDKFLLDLLVWLTFIEIDFKSKKEVENISNNIFEQSFKEIWEKVENNKEEKDFNRFSLEINEKKLNLELFTEKEEDFRKKIEEINEKDFWENIENNDITGFEKELLSLFWEWKEELEKEILSLKITDDENTKTWNI